MRITLVDDDQTPEYPSPAAVGDVVDEDATEAFRGQATSSFTPEHYREKYPENSQLYEDAVKAAREFDPGYVYFREHDIARKPMATPGKTSQHR